MVRIVTVAFSSNKDICMYLDYNTLATPELLGATPVTEQSVKLMSSVGLKRMLPLVVRPDSLHRR